MSYSKFTWDDLKDKFNLNNQQKQLFVDVLSVAPSDLLLQVLKSNAHIPLLSEKARSEGIVYPILVELLKVNNYAFTLYSGVDLPAEKKSGLNGECDFLLSTTPNTIALLPPIFTVVEAKQDNLQRAMPQCAAQMLGARIYNQKRKTNIETIYGCVTTGTDWQFMLLEGNKIYVDTDIYFINNIPLLLGVLQTIIGFYRKVD